MASSGKGKGKAAPDQSTLGTDGDDWKLSKKTATHDKRGTTMTLRRRSNTAKMERSPTVFPSAKMSTFEDAPSAEKRKILDEADKISKDERAKMQRGGSGSSSNIKPGEVDSPPNAHHAPDGQKRTDSEKKRQTDRQL